MKYRIFFDNPETRIQFDGIYQIKDTTDLVNVKILMLKGEDGAGIPSGGSTGQVLTKNSNTSGDVKWATPASGVPTGGTTNQVLAKNSNTSNDLKWMTLSFVPTSRTVNGKALSSNISLNADDVGAMTIPYSDFVPNDGDMIVYGANHSRWEIKTVEAEDVGAIPAPSSPSAGQFLVYDGSAWVAQSLSQWSGGSY